MSTTNEKEASRRLISSERNLRESLRGICTKVDFFRSGNRTKVDPMPARRSCWVVADRDGAERDGATEEGHKGTARGALAPMVRRVAEGRWMPEARDGDRERPGSDLGPAKRGAGSNLRLASVPMRRELARTDAASRFRREGRRLGRRQGMRPGRLRSRRGTSGFAGAPRCDSTCCELRPGDPTRAEPHAKSDGRCIRPVSPVADCGGWMT